MQYSSKLERLSLSVTSEDLLTFAVPRIGWEACPEIKDKGESYSKR
jgi:hypothetical protein